MNNLRFDRSSLIVSLTDELRIILIIEIKIKVLEVN